MSERTHPAGSLLAVVPSGEQLQSLLAGPDGPVVMLNLLRFKAAASAPDEGVSGEEAYRRYVEPMRAFLQEKGVRVLWSGRVDAQVIGAGGEGLHLAALVEYPSRRAFVEVATDPQVATFGIHRAAGLEGQWLLACTTEDL